mmetsp:Transcript_14472/g.37111  ORF Transcript_14472/g.37111 Transcript_14472/m.37111 type:complete len:276 (-) Transcript_14472:819-1646(-)
MVAVHGGLHVLQRVAEACQVLGLLARQVVDQPLQRLQPLGLRLLGGAMRAGLGRELRVRALLRPQILGLLIGRMAQRRLQGADVLPECSVVLRHGTEVLRQPLLGHRQRLDRAAVLLHLLQTVMERAGLGVGVLQPAPVVVGDLHDRRLELAQAALVVGAGGRHLLYVALVGLLVLVQSSFVRLNSNEPLRQRSVRVGERRVKLLGQIREIVLHASEAVHRRPHAFLHSPHGRVLLGLLGLEGTDGAHVLIQRGAQVPFDFVKPLSQRGLLRLKQ